MHRRSIKFSQSTHSPDSIPFRSYSRKVLELSIILSAALLASAATPGLAQATDCRVGTYRLADGSDVDVGPADSAHLRWRRMDGTTGELTRAADGWWMSTLGWTGRPDGKRVSFDCARNAIDFSGSLRWSSGEKGSFGLFHILYSVRSIPFRSHSNNVPTRAIAAVGFDGDCIRRRALNYYRTEKNRPTVYSPAVELSGATGEVL
jgi:hypothetical protein